MLGPKPLPWLPGSDAAVRLKDHLAAGSDGSHDHGAEGPDLGPNEWQVSSWHA